MGMPTIVMRSNTPPIIMRILAQFFPVKTANPMIRAITPTGKNNNAATGKKAARTPVARRITIAARIWKIPMIVTPKGLSIFVPIGGILCR